MRTGSGSPHFREAALGTVCHEDSQMTGQAGRQTEYQGRELPSEGTALGALQVPANGQPVLFLADHPLTGGYPVIGCVAPHHLDLAAQLPPGVFVRFKLMAPFAEIPLVGAGA